MKTAEYYYVVGEYSGTEVDGRRQAKPGTRRQRRTRAAGRTPTAQPRRTASLAASRPKGGAPRHQEDRQPRGRPPSGCHGGPPAAGPHPRCGGPERGAERRGTGKWPGSGRGSTPAVVGSNAHAGSLAPAMRGARQTGHPPPCVRCSTASHLRHVAWQHRCASVPNLPGGARESGSGEGRMSEKSQ